MSIVYFLRTCSSRYLQGGFSFSRAYGHRRTGQATCNGDDRRLRHIGNAPVHWHEETFSSGGILLSDENATVFLTSSDLQPVAPTQTATLNAICFFFDRIKIFQASIPQTERISYTVLFHALPVTLLSEDYRGQ